MNDSEFINYNITNSELGFAADEIKKNDTFNRSSTRSKFQKI